MGTRIYTVSQLLALRPLVSVSPLQGTTKVSNDFIHYTNVLRSYNRLVRDGPKSVDQSPYPPKIVYKYDYVLSNKEFKRRWVKSHGTSSGLKDLKRMRVTVFSIRVAPLERFFLKLRRLEKLVNKLGRRIGKSTGNYSSFVPKSEPNLVSKSSKVSAVRPRKKSRAVARVTQARNGLLNTNVIGGKSVDFDPLKPPPKAEWKKYSYFYRTRGYWKPSVHHPYGDESKFFTEPG